MKKILVSVIFLFIFLRVGAPAFASTVLDQNYPTSNYSSHVSLRVANTANDKFSMQFIPTVSAGINKIQWYLAKAGSPLNHVWAELWLDNGSGLPYTYLGSSSTILSSDVTTSPTYTLYDFNFSPTIMLTAGVKYNAVINGDYATNASNFIAVGSKSSGTSWLVAQWSINDYLWEPIISQTFIFYEYYDSATIPTPTPTAPPVSPTPTPVFFLGNVDIASKSAIWGGLYAVVGLQFIMAWVIAVGVGWYIGNWLYKR